MENPINQYMNQFDFMNYRIGQQSTGLASDDHDFAGETEEIGDDEEAYYEDQPKDTLYLQEQSRPIEVDEIKIKPKQKTFEEMLNEQLQNNADAIPDEDVLRSQKPLFDYHKRPKINDKLLLKPSDNVNKYKYYAQSFDKKFGTGEEKPIIYDELSYNKKLKPKQQGKASAVSRSKLNTNSSTAQSNFEKKAGALNTKEKLIERPAAMTAATNNNVGGAQAKGYMKTPIQSNNLTLNQPNNDLYGKVNETNSDYNDDIKKMTTTKIKELKQPDQQISNSNHIAIQKRDISPAPRATTKKVPSDQGNYQFPSTSTKIDFLYNDEKSFQDQKKLEQSDLAVLIAPIQRPKIIEELIMERNRGGINKGYAEVPTSQYNKMNKPSEEDEDDYLNFPPQRAKDIGSIYNNYQPKDLKSSKDDKESFQIEDQGEEAKEDIDQINEEADEDDDDRDIINKYKLNNRQLFDQTNVVNQPLQKPSYLNEYSIKKDEEGNKLNNIENSDNSAISREPQKIISKYFKQNISSIKDKPISVPVPPKSIEATSNYEGILNDPQNLFRAKIQELEAEINKYKMENEKVSKLKNEYSKLNKELKTELSQVSEIKEKEMKEFNAWKDAELKKLEKDKKVHARNVKAMQEMPNRKEREEIENLNKQLQSLRDEMKSKDSKNKMNETRLKKLVEELKCKNEELSKQLKTNEDLRIKQMSEFKAFQLNAQQAAAASGGSSNVMVKQVPVNNGRAIGSNNPTSNIRPNTNNPRDQIIKGGSQFEQVQGMNQNTVAYYDRAGQKLSKPNNIAAYNPRVESNSLDNSYEDSVDNKKNSDEFTSTKILQVNDSRQGLIRQPVITKQYQGQLNTQEIVQASAAPKKLQNYTDNAKEINNKENSFIKVNQPDSYNSQQMTRLQDTKPNKNIGTSGSQPSKQPPLISKSNPSNIESLDPEDYKMTLPEKYHGDQYKTLKLIKQDISNDGKVIRVFENGKKEIIFPSGVRKEIYEDNYTIVFFTNNDIKQIYPDGKTVYYYAESDTFQTTFPDGVQVFKFNSGQVEFHYPDMSKKLILKDGAIKYLMANGYEETIYPDGTIQKEDPNGVVTLEYEDGSKLVIQKDGTKYKEFPNGTVMKIHTDGRQEKLKSY